MYLSNQENEEHQTNRSICQEQFVTLIFFDLTGGSNARIKIEKIVELRAIHPFLESQVGKA